MQEHHTRLFENVTVKLKVAAQRRKERHDQSVWSEPLAVGQEVWLKEFGWKGRHKIQDRWNPVVHQVIKAPPGNGAVYTVALTTDLATTKQVHRTLLEAAVGMATRDDLHCSLANSPGQPATVESSDEEDLFTVVRGPTHPQTGHRVDVPPVPASATFIAPVAPLTSTFPAPLVLSSSAAETVVQRGTQPVPLPGPIAECSSTVGTSPTVSLSPHGVRVVRRRTTRPTAGQHSNLHHLPRPVNEVAQAASSAVQANAGSAFFRSWS